MELGIREVELRSIWGRSIVDHDEGSLRRIGDALDRGGFRVCAIASPFLKCHIAGHGAAAGATHSARDAGRDEQGAILDRSLDVAARFDAPVVRAFSFWRVEQPETVRDEVVATLQEATARVRAAGRLLGLENEHACNVATGAESAWVLDRIPDRTLGLIWDPGNEAALGSAPFPDGYSAVRGRIHHIHVKDAVALGDGRFTTVGDGVIPYEDQLRVLAADGYDGILSLETHFASPDGGKEAATRVCAAALRDLCDRAGLQLDA